MALTSKFPILFTSFDGFSFVVQFLTASQPDLQFEHISVVEEEPQWNQGISFFFDLGPQPADLPFLKKQFSITQRIVVIDRTVRIRGDVQGLDPNCSILFLTKTIVETDASFPNGFHLRSQHNHTGYVSVIDKILMKRLSVVEFEHEEDTKITRMAPEC